MSTKPTGSPASKRQADRDLMAGFGRAMFVFGIAFYALMLAGLLA
jgi:hypothetical protein